MTFVVTSYLRLLVVSIVNVFVPCRTGLEAKLNLRKWIQSAPAKCHACAHAVPSTGIISFHCMLISTVQTPGHVNTKGGARHRLHSIDLNGIIYSKGYCPCIDVQHNRILARQEILDSCHRTVALDQYYIVQLSLTLHGALTVIL